MKHLDKPAEGIHLWNENLFHIGARMTLKNDDVNKSQQCYVTMSMGYAQCDQKKSPNVYKSCQKWFHSKLNDFDTFAKLTNNEGDFGKIIVF